MTQESKKKVTTAKELAFQERGITPIDVDRNRTKRSMGQKLVMQNTTAKPCFYNVALDKDKEWVKHRRLTYPNKHGTDEYNHLQCLTF